MAYIYPAPGVADAEATLTVKIFDPAISDTAGYILPALQDVTVNAANDVFTWTQLDSGSKQQIATTATNSLTMNIVLDQTAFFGDGAATPTGGAENKGIWGLSGDKSLVSFDLYLGDESTGGVGKTISGVGYITGLAPTVSADSPVWISPITITVTGDYTIA
jgi:hypothetical protein